MAKVLVIGGAGYIGSHVAKALRLHSHQVAIFDNFSTGFRELTLENEVWEGDLCDYERIVSVIDQYQPEVVFLFAGLISVGESVSDPAPYYRNNINGCINALTAIQSKAPKAKIVFSSSAAVYGVPQAELTETHPLRAMNPYGRTKLMMEEVLADFSSAYGLQYASIRYFNAAGSDADLEVGELHEPETHLIPRVLLHAIHGDIYPVQINGSDYDTPDGTCIRDYVHVSDLASIHLRAMDYLFNVEENLIVNAGSGSGYSVREVVQMVEKVTGRTLDIPIGPRRAGDPDRLIANSEKAKKVLDWKPTHDLESMVHSAWQWIQKKRSS